MWLAEALPQQTAEALISSTDQPPGTVERALVETCGVGYVEAGAMLADAWKLPIELRCAIAHQVEPVPGDDIRALVVSAATRMVGHVRRSQNTDTIEPGLAKLGIDDDAQKNVLERLDQSGTRTAELAEALFTGRWRLDYQSPSANASVASIRRRRVLGSAAECPASATIDSSLPDHAWCSCHAFSIGQITS